MGEKFEKGLGFKSRYFRIVRNAAELRRRSRRWRLEVRIWKVVDCPVVEMSYFGPFRSDDAVKSMQMFRRDRTAH